MKEKRNYFTLESAAAELKPALEAVESSEFAATDFKVLLLGLCAGPLALEAGRAAKTGEADLLRCCMRQGLEELPEEDRQKFIDAFEVSADAAGKLPPVKAAADEAEDAEVKPPAAKKQKVRKKK